MRLVDSKKQAGDRLHKFALDHQRRHPRTPYAEALAVARRLNPEWARHYDGAEKVPQNQEVGAVVDRAVKAYQQKHPGVNYGEALRIYLDENPRMKAAYSGIPVPIDDGKE